MDYLFSNSCAGIAVVYILYIEVASCEVEVQADTDVGKNSILKRNF
jgi:hypothetical protein